MIWYRNVKCPPPKQRIWFESVSYGTKKAIQSPIQFKFKVWHITKISIWYNCFQGSIKYLFNIFQARASNNRAFRFYGTIFFKTFFKKLFLRNLKKLLFSRKLAKCNFFFKDIMHLYIYKSFNLKLFFVKVFREASCIYVIQIFFLIIT